MLKFIATLFFAQVLVAAPLPKDDFAEEVLHAAEAGNGAAEVGELGIAAAVDTVAEVLTPMCVLFCK